MTDLYIGLAIMSCVSLLVLLCTVKWTRPMKTRAVTLTGILAAMLLLAYLRFAWKTALLATVLPFSSVVILSNWFPPAAAFLAGITWTHGYGTGTRRVLFGLTLYLIAFYSSVDPLLGQPPECRNRWQMRRDFPYPMARQTSGYSCTAAAAATLLRINGIQAEESEMVQLCLTRNGTTWQGLYRGLKLKTAGLPFRIEVIECPVQELENSLPGPAILSVGIDPSQPYLPEYVEEKGWDPGMRHSVVLLGFQPNFDGVVVADPSVGFEPWTTRDIQTLWRGRAVCLVPTDSR
ncbi:MAG: cysteine peptidase family C39 domain-containing protein [Planctomycetaceae bacterium]